ncbi:LLM class flavin-dependent oxidoreductase [Microlunatus soli]|uniref:Probable F420-dependent oxidoreductase, Rv2161c family n=1 Tax=Microlunatus soli TaxID=630515 RepID=A0A1H1Y880_9ACTN|nr:LLM class flavin-dependent oxidoreductase [Microlunatus soli]SDT17673.1 probable F420-dependent oxidoreductase, Rv2161c family [Microlunatus soli]
MTPGERRRLRFGVLGTDDADVADQARQAEALGFDIFALSDHLHGSRPTLEPWTALTWAAAATERIAVLTDVLGLPYREPPVLAKMAETLDRLSGGRLILGLGNGGYEPEFAAFGLATRTPGQKVAALGEAIEILRALWSGRATTSDGEHYRLTDAVIAPPPEHPIPIWVGSYGPKALAQTGALADGWLPSIQRLEPDQAAAMKKAVDEAAVSAGRHPGDLSYACNIQVGSGDAGTTVRQLRDIAALGFDTFVVAGLTDSRAREQFAREIVPLVVGD